MSLQYGLKTPQTTNERRKWMEAEELMREWGSVFRTRQARSFKHLPDAWDDIVCRFNDQNCWKSQRKTHYRLKPIRDSHTRRHPPSKT